MTNALMREEKRPVHTSSMTIEDTTHTEHTTGKRGDFEHPFHQVAPEVQTIWYPKSKTISKKLHRVQGLSRHHADHGNTGQGRAIGSNVSRKSSSSNYWE